MGHLLGHGVRFGVARDVMAAGEGIETMLSLRCVMPDHADGGGALGGASLRHPVPWTLRRLYIVRDDDPAGDGAAASLIDRANAAGNRGDHPVANAGGLQRGSPPRWASMRFGLRSGRKSRRRMSHASWNCRREPKRGIEFRGGSRMRVASDRGAPRVVGEDRAHGLLRGRSGRQTARPGNGFGPTIFRRAPERALCIARQNSRPSPSSTSLRPFAALRVHARTARRLSSP